MDLPLALQDLQLLRPKGTHNCAGRPKASAIAKNAHLPLTENAAGYKRPTQPPCEWSCEVIAKCYGFSARSSVHKIIDLLDQPDPIQDLLSRDIIGEEQLHFLSRIKDLDAKVKVAKPAADEGGQSK